MAQHSVAMLEQCCNYSKQCHNNVATLCCAKNRRRESSRVKSPLDLYTIRDILKEHVSMGHLGCVELHYVTVLRTILDPISCTTPLKPIKEELESQN